MPLPDVTSFEASHLGIPELGKTAIQLHRARPEVAMIEPPEGIGLQPFPVSPCRCGLCVNGAGLSLSQPPAGVALGREGVRA